MSLLRFALTTCVVLILHTAASAQPCVGGRCPRPAEFAAAPATTHTPHPAIVRIRNVTNGSASIGSGALVGCNRAGDGVVLSAWHLFRDGVGQVYVDFPGGERRMGTVAQVDRGDDLAAVLVANPPVAPLLVSDSDMPGGAPIAFAGYGSEGIYRLQAGHVIERASFDAGATWAARAWTGQARGGDSGGPAFDALGRVCGVVSAARRGQTVGTCGPRVRQFLDGVCVPVTNPSAPAVRASQEDASTQRPPSTPQDWSMHGEVQKLRAEMSELRDQLAKRPNCQCPATAPSPACPCDLQGLEERLVAQLRPVERKPATHLVVVADRKATTWPRLADEIRAAQRSFHRIVVSDLPPFSVGLLPQLIEYEAGKPRRVFKGERDVAAQLALIRRGEYPR